MTINKDLIRVLDTLINAINYLIIINLLSSLSISIGSLNNPLL